MMVERLRLEFVDVYLKKFLKISIFGFKLKDIENILFIILL